MKNILYTLLLIAVANLIHAQEVVQVSVGESYANATFYSLSNQETTTIAHTDWDIAFEVDARGAGIHVNEGVLSSFGTPAPQVELYYNDATDFATADTTGSTRLYNPDQTWSVGAFNSVSAEGNPLDLGWGVYDVNTHAINGSRVFFIKIRNGEMKKIQIESLTGGLYTFKYANMDGTGEITRVIDKADFPDKTLVYYSFENDSVLDLEPSEWDLLFTRYSTPLDAGDGSTIDYTVTGIFVNAGSRVAVGRGVDPATADHEAYADDYTDMVSTIGFDWKDFDFQAGWSIPEDRVYFVQTSAGEIYKIQFLDFEGSSSGVTTLQVELEEISNIDTPNYLSSIDIYPNPATSFIQIDLSTPVALGEVSFELINALGQSLQHRTVAVYEGDYSERLELSNNMVNGLYYLVISSEDSVITRPVFIE
ncbi:MAG: HmuY family protein [Bacteroidota bacterium]